MRTIGTVALLFVCFSVCYCVPNSIRFNGPQISKGWQEKEVFHLSPMTLTFALKQRNLEQLEDIFWGVSTPGSPQYRKFLSPTEVSALVAPTTQVVAIVNNWLVDSGVSSSKIEINPSRDFLIARGVNAKIISNLLHCDLRSFYHDDSGRTTQVCINGYSLPNEIAAVVDFVGGLTYFPNMKHKVPLQPLDGTSNAPILVKTFPGDENFSLFFAPLCSDGNTATNPNLYCSNGDAITGVNVKATQNGFQHSILLQNRACMNCSSWPSALQSYCEQANTEYSLPDSTVYCHSNPISFSLKNYIPIYIELQTQYDSGVSAAAKIAQPIYCGEFVTPSVLREYYGISGAQAICQHPSNSQSVAEFLGQYYSPTDLLSFFQMAAVQSPGHVELVGFNNVTYPGIEASLDIQYIMGVAQNVTTYFWSLGNLHDGQEPFLEWITQVLNSQRPPLVHSVSYGDDESSLTSDYMNRVNTEFMKAGTVGVTLLFSSGDNGVNAADPGAPSCTEISQFTPGFPASSPYVTAVGGTQFSTRTEGFCSETTQYGVPISCNTVGEISASIATGARITSGGGFSNVFAMPDYQKQVVSAYLAGQSIPNQFYNSSGRAYPDISACARNFLVISDGEIHPTDGTSAAAPTAAAMMTLINDVLLPKHQNLGFLNPTLYSLPSNNFLDIIQGDNSCGEDITSCCPYGFTTDFGWDAVTGLGSINFQTLLHSLTS